MRVSMPAGPCVAAGAGTGRAVRLLALAALVLLAACASQHRLTERATGCRDVTIVGSDFKRDGVETAWCARCGTKMYQCATNADRTDVKCFEAKEGGPCS